MLLVKQELLGSLAAELEKLSPGAGDKALFESPKVSAHGDLACTAAMQLAKPLKRNPRQVAEALRSALTETEPFRHWVAAIEIAGPGFLNIRLKPQAKQQVVAEVLAAAAGFGTVPANGRRLMVEFVSANPTGPLHVGHGRQAALGDAIAKLLQSQGAQVSREFYYNDAGQQIENLAVSVRARAREILGESGEFPEDGYRGDYIRELAQRYLDEVGNDLSDIETIRRFAVAELRKEQDRDLQAFGVRFDNYYIESSLY